MLFSQKSHFFSFSKEPFSTILGAGRGGLTNLASADIWMTPNEDSQYENHFYILNVHVIGISYKRFSRFLRYFLYLRLFAFSWFGSSIEEASGTLSVALKAVALVTPISSPQHPKMCLLLQPAKKKHLL